MGLDWETLFTGLAAIKDERKLCQECEQPMMKMKGSPYVEIECANGVDHDTTGLRPGDQCPACAAKKKISRVALVPYSGSESMFCTNPECKKAINYGKH